MTLRQKRALFPRLLARLFKYAEKRGLEVNVGEAYRTPEQAALYVAQGSGIRNSLHMKKLAIDLLLFDPATGQYLADGAHPHYTLLGRYWKRQHPLCRWGGDFTGPIPRDAGHFSLTHGGVQ